MSKESFDLFDHRAMDIALIEAKKAFVRGEVPVGAAFFLKGELIACASNMVEEYKDGSMHAELLCLRRSAKKLGDFRLSEGVLYSTLEPCIMCAGAIYNFRVKKVIYGAKDLRVGACGTLYNLFDGSHPITKVQCVGGLKKEESAKLLKEFFQQQRDKKNGKST